MTSLGDAVIDSGADGDTCLADLLCHALLKEKS
jgi:hypothetical protein